MERAKGGGRSRGDKDNDLETIDRNMRVVFQRVMMLHI